MNSKFTVFGERTILKKGRLTCSLACHKTCYDLVCSLYAESIISPYFVFLNMIFWLSMSIAE